MPYAHDNGTPVPENGDNASSNSLGAYVLSSTQNQKPIIGIDYARYEHLLGDSALSDDDKREVLDALWSIISNFIQLGFGIHPIQQAMEAKGSYASQCGQLKSSQDSESLDLLSCEDSPTIIERENADAAT